jgi:hypothetical protein
MDGGSEAGAISKNLLEAERDLRIRTLLHRTGIVKNAGIPVINVINHLMGLVLRGAEIGAVSCAAFGKDAACRLKNNCRLNWRAFQLSAALRFVSETRAEDNDGDGGGISLIADDTFFRKTGYKIEGSSI